MEPPDLLKQRQSRVRSSQEDQLGALGLVVNAIALSNTRYMAAAPDYLRANEGHVRAEDVARPSPLRHGHINLALRVGVGTGCRLRPPPKLRH